MTIVVASTTTDGTVIDFLGHLKQSAVEVTTATASAVVQSDTVLNLVVDADADPVAPGDTLTYTLTYGNRTTGSSALGSDLVMPLPAGTSFVSATGGGVYDSGAGTVSWSLGAVGAGQGGKVELQLQVGGALGEGTVIEAAPTLTDDSGEQARAALVTRVQSGAPLSVRVSQSPEAAHPGDAVTVTYTVTNNSGADRFAVMLEGQLPVGLDPFYESTTLPVGDCDTPNLGVPNRCDAREWLTVDLGTIVAGETVTVTVPVTISSSTTEGYVIPFNARLSDGSNVLALGSQALLAGNAAPVANDDTDVTDEDTPVTTINVLTNDTDANGDTLSVSAVDAVSYEGGDVVDNGDGTFDYTPPADFYGTDSFEYTVSDGNGGTDRGTVTITVNPLPDDPVANADTDVTDEDTVLTTTNVLANDTDADGDSLSVSAVDATSTEGGSVTDNGDGTFDYTPAADFNGSDSFNYTINDGTGRSAQGTVTITVNAVNDDPVAADDARITSQDTSVTTGNVLSNDSDVDGDTLTVSAVDATSTEGGSVTDNGDGTFDYTPPTGFSGEDSFTYTVSDGNGGSDQGTVNVTVSTGTATNVDPVAGSDTVTTDEDTLVTTASVLTNDTDANGDTLSVSAVDAASSEGGDVVDNGDGTFDYTPPADFNGSDSFVYTVSDGNGGSDQGTVTITVNAVNDDPVATDDSLTANQDVTVTTGNVLTNDSDKDGDSLTVSAVDATSAQGGSVTDNGDGTFGYTPPSGFAGNDNFSYTISDGNGGTDNGTVNITVKASSSGGGSGGGGGAFGFGFLLMLLISVMGRITRMRSQTIKSHGPGW